MKTFIKSAAALVAFGLLSTGAFASVKPAEGNPKPAVKDKISFTQVSGDCSVGVMVHKLEKGSTAVTITDASGKVVMKDELSNQPSLTGKAYNFEGMDEGDYTIAVRSNDETVTKTVHVYDDENDQKLFVYSE